jgi:MFS family permease
MGSTFYILYAKQRFQVDDAFAANLTMAALISQTISTPLLGWLADHWGHKLLTELTTVIAILGVLLIAVAPGPIWLYGVFMLVNAATAGLSIATDEHRPGVQFARESAHLLGAGEYDPGDNRCCWRRCSAVGWCRNSAIPLSLSGRSSSWSSVGPSCALGCASRATCAPNRSRRWRPRRHGRIAAGPCARAALWGCPLARFVWLV